MIAIVVRYLALVGLLLTVAWIASGPHQWEPWITFISTMAVYLGTDVYSLAANHGGQREESHDHKLFKIFLRDLPSNGSIDFIKRANMAGYSFSSSRLNQLNEFWHEWTDVEHEFSDKNLEAKKRHPFNLADKYMNLITTVTFPTRNPDRVTVPPEWEEKYPDRFHKAVTELHDLAGKVVEAHQDLVRLGRNRLKISPLALSETADIKSSSEKPS